MADTRAVDDPINSLGDLQKQFADFQTTIQARIYRRPTGDIEPAMITVPGDNQLICNGATYNRADYIDLWQFAIDNGLNGTLFGNGDGSTTFKVPDLRGRVARGVAATGEVLGQFVGADSVTLTANNLPAHTHSVSLSNAGGHGGHLPAVSPVSGGGSDTQLLMNANDAGNTDGSHGHSWTFAAAGDPTSFDVRAQGIAINWIIWT